MEQFLVGARRECKAWDVQLARVSADLATQMTAGHAAPTGSRALLTRLSKLPGGSA